MKALSRDCSGHEADYSQCVDTGSFVCDYQQTDLVGVVCSKVSSRYSFLCLSGGTDYSGGQQSIFIACVAVCVLINSGRTDKYH